MNHKMLREDYYNEEYALNEQEEKEFLMPVKDPYWLVRGRAFLLDIDIFGRKDYLQQQIEILLFNPPFSSVSDPGKIIPAKSDAQRVAGLDFFDKKFGPAGMDIGYQENFPKSSRRPDLRPVYTLIPELKLMKKDLSYYEVYTMLSKLADPQILFINMFKEKPENNLINGIIYFPYTPKIIESMSNSFIFDLCNYNCSDGEKIKILKQKLLDLYYLVDDCEDLHGVTDCQNLHNNCDNISSFFCENNMCKTCCEKSTSKEFCIIHDDIVYFYRKKMQDLFEFEQHHKTFDRSVTIRISVRQRITKSELKMIFEEDGYKIDWDSIDFNFRKSVEKIQFVYLQCKSNQDAKRLYDDRSKIMKKWEKLEINIQSLMEAFEDVIHRVCSDNPNNIFTSCLLVVPCSNLLKNFKKVPPKSERNKKFAELIENTLGIDNTKYSLQNCKNPISSDFLSYDYYTIIFKTKELLDQFYCRQPYFDAVIVHKFTHLKFFPHLRNKNPIWSKTLCINCPARVNDKCWFELCTECCRRQKNFIGDLIMSIRDECCPCRVQSVGVLTIAGKCPTCGIAPVAKACMNNLCEKCCSLQIMPEKSCLLHSKVSKYQKYLASLTSFQNFVNNYQLKFSNIKLKIMNYLKNGDFHWFRPLADTNVTRLMLDMNKELMIIMDNQNFKREGPLKINDKMYKVFTYQNETILKKDYTSTDNQFNSPPFFSTREGFDERGEYYVEYDLTNNNDYQIYPNTYVPAKPDRMESIEARNIDRELSETENALKNSFHLVLYGLDSEKLSTFDLTEEIFHELRSNFTKISKEDIQILDEVSVINLILNNNPDFTSYEKFADYGRMALVKFKSEKEALKLYLEKIKICLPLVHNKKGMPLLYPGELLKNYIEDN